MTRKSEPACGPGFHVNNHTDNRLWDYTFCDCGRWQVDHGATLYDETWKEEKMPDYTHLAGTLAKLDQTREPPPAVSYMILLPNGEFVFPDGTNSARANPKQFYKRDEVEAKVVDLMIRANQLGVQDYKPTIITCTETRVVKYHHAIEPGLAVWVENQDAILHGRVDEAVEWVDD
jgi:hypothetical protein